jgi:hypothetical protein
MSGDQFRCVVASPAGTATSTTGLLTVELPRIAPLIVTQPAGQTVNVGQSATLSVVANGSPSPTYQWYRGSNPIFGATGASFRLTAAQIADAGNYFVEVSNTWGTIISAIVPIDVIPVVNAVDSFRFSLLAGQPGAAGMINATGNAALFRSPNGLAVDSEGNLFVADESNHVIRKITPAGVVTTFAGLALSGGNDNGTGTQARFLYPRGLTMDAGGTLYVADTFNHTIRKITSAGVVTTLAGRAGNAGATDGKGAAASFNYPVAVAIDPAGNLYVADRSNHLVRKVTPDGTVSTLAGTVGVSGCRGRSRSRSAIRQPGRNCHRCQRSGLRIRFLQPRYPSHFSRRFGLDPRRPARCGRQQRRDGTQCPVPLPEWLGERSLQQPVCRRGLQFHDSPHLSDGTGDHAGRTGRISWIRGWHRGGGPLPHPDRGRP